MKDDFLQVFEDALKWFESFNIIQEYDLTEADMLVYKIVCDFWQEERERLGHEPSFVRVSNYGILLKLLKESQKLDIDSTLKSIDQSLEHLSNSFCTKRVNPLAPLKPDFMEIETSGFYLNIDKLKIYLVEDNSKSINVYHISSKPFIL